MNLIIGSDWQDRMEEAVFSRDFGRLCDMLLFFLRESLFPRPSFPDRRYREEILLKIARGDKELAERMLWNDLAFNGQDGQGLTLPQRIARAYAQLKADMQGLRRASRSGSGLHRLQAGRSVGEPAFRPFPASRLLFPRCGQGPPSVGFARERRHGLRGCRPPRSVTRRLRSPASLRPVGQLPGQVLRLRPLPVVRKEAPATEKRRNCYEFIPVIFILCA